MRRRLFDLLVATAAIGGLGWTFVNSDHPAAELSRSFVLSKLHEYYGTPRILTRNTLEKRLEGTGLALGDPVLIRIFKEESALEIWVRKDGRFKHALTYPICTWSGRLGPKLREGDGQSPEGFYFASSRQLNPNSNYHRAINIGFPNAFDRAQGRTGTYLMIHGSCVSIGCYAITDAGIDDIYRLVAAALQAGQANVPLQIFPFRMTAENLAQHRGSEWVGFWYNLAEGDRIFLQSGLPPPVSVCGERYAFGGASAACQTVTAW